MVILPKNVRYLLGNSAWQNHASETFDVTAHCLKSIYNVIILIHTFLQSIYMIKVKANLKVTPITFYRRNRGLARWG
jgi:hypothetical protein